MFIKSVSNQNKYLSLTLYKNNIALIHEKRATLNNKSTSNIEYYNISKSIDESSLVVKKPSISEVDFNFSSYCPKIKCKTNNFPHDNEQLEINSFTIKDFPANTKEIEIYYLSRDINWSYCYNLYLNESTLNLESWFNLSNHSGTSYNNATIKFISGNINIPSAPDLLPKASAMNLTDSTISTEDSLEDYYVYSLHDTYAIPNNITKKIKHLSVESIDYNKCYDFSYSSTNANIIIEFINTKENNLGIHLPSGSAYVYTDYENELQFLGGNLTDNTSTDKLINLNIGASSDATCTRSVIDSEIQDGYEIKSIEFIIKNNKNQDIEFLISHPIFKSWEMIDCSDEFFKNSDNNPYFKGFIKANNTQRISFKYKTLQSIF